jgi:hypothetical protein
MKLLDPINIANNPEKYAKICLSTWAPVIQNSALGEESWLKVFQYFSSYQLFYLDENGEWLGFANTIPIHYQDPLPDLPDTGWDWLIEKGIADYEGGKKPNVLGGLQIGINPIYRGKRFSKKILEQAKALMVKKKFEKFILPIRPTLKHLHPDIPMKDYLKWKKEDKIYDPWIRTHLQSGAKIIKVCPEAMRVEGTISDWEKWTGRTFPKSGQYAIKGALSLVNINLEKNRGLYLEPNIWIYYDK